MKKKVGIIKRMSCLLLIFLLSINSFAAIVSDNDGSAFITKAEFDALKSSFQSQIDSYNQSIDSKIDGAIASYLAGIRLSTEEDIKLLYELDATTTKKIRNVPSTYFTRDFPVAPEINISIIGMKGYTYGSYAPLLSEDRFPAPTEKTTHEKSGYYWAHQRGMFYTDFIWPGSGRGFLIDPAQPTVLKSYHTELFPTISGAHAAAWLNAKGNYHHYFKTTYWDGRTKDVKWRNQLSYTNRGESWTNYGYTDNSKNITSDDTIESKYGTDNPGNNSSAMLYLTDTICSMHMSEPDPDIYLMTSVASNNVYMYNNNWTYVKFIADNVDDVAGRKKYTGGRFIIPTGATGWLWVGEAQWPSANTDGGAMNLGGLCFPRIAIVKDDTVTTTSYSLAGYKNGTIGYQPTAGSALTYPYFYQGLPLFRADKDYQKIQFSIKTADSAGGSCVLQLKKGPFLSGASSSWSATEKANLINIGKVGGSKSTQVTITDGTKTDIELNNVAKNDMIFLRVYGSSGIDTKSSITYLTDCVGTIEN